MTSGLGDSYGAMYRSYLTQEYLKKLGYNTTTYVNIGLNPYKMNNNDREIFKKIFRLDMFDDLNIILHEFNLNEYPFESNYELVFNNDGIFKVYVDTKLEDYNFTSYFFWQDMDELPKINMFSDYITQFCENKLKSFPEKFYSIHYRWHEIQDKETSFQESKNLLMDFLEENKNVPIFVCSSDQDFKIRLTNLNYTNVFFNDYQFPENWYARTYDWSDEKLLEFFAETLFEMYVLSKSEKILRLCNWFSGFLFFSNSFNQTNISNKVRYHPPFR